jgi:hypothetical protein
MRKVIRDTFSVIRRKHLEWEEGGSLTTGAPHCLV